MVEAGSVAEWRGTRQTVMDSKLCLCLMCGLPASGKSTLARHIQDHVGQLNPAGQLCVLVLHYDWLIPPALEQQLVTQTDEQGGSLWKLMRNQITTCMDHLLNILKHEPKKPLGEIVNGWCDDGDDVHTSSTNVSPTTDNDGRLSNHLVRPSGVDGGLWERFLSLLRNSVKGMLQPHGSRCEDGDDGVSWLLLVDDNMQYSSMRYQYCQLARKHGAGFCTVHVVCPVEEALQRNRCREEEGVEESVITLMHQRLEMPDPDKRSWEKYSASVSGNTAADLHRVLGMVWAAMRDPQHPAPEEDGEGRAVSRHVCSTSAVHQADQILRRTLSLHMAEAKRAGLCSGEMKTMSAELTRVRTAILNDLRKGEVTVPFPLDEAEVSDASKNPDCAFFQFVQALFAARTNCRS